jgi:hypothetical protein
MLGTLISGGLFGFAGSLFKGVMGYFDKKASRKHEVDMIVAQQNFMVAEANAQIEITEAQVRGAVELADAEAYQLSQATGHTDITKESWINKLLEPEAGWFRKFVGAILVALMSITDVIRRLMRPVLTAYVMVGATWVTWLVWQILTFHATNTGADGTVTVSFQAILTKEQAMLIFLQVIDFTFFMAASGFGWWFGDRAITKGLMKKYGDK